VYQAAARWLYTAMLQIASTQIDPARPTGVPLRRAAVESVSARISAPAAPPNAHARQRSLVQASLLLSRRTD
jgi:hypothetical protein